MTLIICKECKNQISSTAKMCPQCGAKNKRTSLLVKGFVIFVLIVGVIPTIIDTIQGPLQPTPEALPTPEKVAADQRRAEQQSRDALDSDRAYKAAMTIKKSLRNPASFDVDSVVVMQNGAICYNYRAQNGLGGLNLEMAVFPPGNSLIKTQGMPGFTAAWKKDCDGKNGRDFTHEVAITTK